jgi:hypothetical protein
VEPTLSKATGSLEAAERAARRRNHGDIKNFIPKHKFIIDCSGGAGIL